MEQLTRRRRARPLPQQLVLFLLLLLALASARAATPPKGSLGQQGQHRIRPDEPDGNRRRGVRLPDAQSYGHLVSGVGVDACACVCSHACLPACKHACMRVWVEQRACKHPGMCSETWGLSNTQQWQQQQQQQQQQQASAQRCPAQRLDACARACTHACVGPQCRLLCVLMAPRVTHDSVLHAIMCHMRISARARALRTPAGCRA